MTTPHVFGVVEGDRTSQPEAVTNTKLNTHTDAIIELQALVGFAVIGGVAFPITAGAADSAGTGFRTLRIPNS